jgi:hypothetical protein
MTNMVRSARGASSVVMTMLMLTGLGGCKMDVTNPAVIDASNFDPASDGATISLSAQQDFYSAYAQMAQFGGYLAGEMWTGAARAEDKALAQRTFDYTNLDLNVYMWSYLSRSLAANEDVITSLGNDPGAASDVNLARAEMNSGFSFVLMGENFCEGLILSGPALTDSQLLDSAITRFTQAIGVGKGAAAAGTAEGTKIANASTIGLARAYLQKGDYALAAQAAGDAIANDPTGTFVYKALYTGASTSTYYNTVYVYTTNLRNVVPDMYRALNDTGPSGRVRWADANQPAEDGQIELYTQLKYTDYGSPIRVASTLEARYILAEANLQSGITGPAATLIAERRAVNPGATYLPAPASLLSQLEDVRVRDFWMEAKKVGDMRRNPNDTPYISPAGTPFYEGATTTYGTASCFPIPIEEVSANPNLSNGNSNERE